MNETGMALIYHVPYGEYTGGTPRARLVYRINTRHPVILDAVTGQSLDYQGQPVELKDAKQFEDIPAAGGEMNPPVPGKERIGATEAMEKAARFFRALGYEGEVERRGGGSGGGPLGREEYWSYGLKQKEGQDWYFEYISVGIEVFTGRIAHFHGRGPYGERASIPEGKAIAREEAVKIAREFIKKVEPELAGYLALEKTAPWYEGPPVHHIRFSRVANGVPFPLDGINMTVGHDGKIIDYNCQWHRVTFPPARAEISAGDAARTWLERSPLKLKYFFPRDENIRLQQPKLVYQPEYSGAQYIDAHTGEALGDDGRPLNQAAGNKYDFTGSWAVQQLQIMAGSGLLPPPEKFSPTAPVTRRDGIRLLMAAAGNRYGDGDERRAGPYFEDIKNDDPDYRTIQWAADMGIIEKGGQFRPGDNLTRTTLAAWLVNSMGYKNVASITNKIESPFNDIAELSRQDQNYIGLANGLGFMAGNGTQNFRPGAAVTWEELSAAVLKAAPKLRNRTMW
ncbi:MAG: S-layer homology domain-containing protein [Bacillota bacterium]